MPRTKITASNLTQYVGQRVQLNNIVGAVFCLYGILQQGSFTWWKIQLPDGELIHFSFGEFQLSENQLRINIQ